MRPVGKPWLSAPLAMAAIIACTALAAPARADPKAAVTITVIHAKKGRPFLHPELSSMWETLKKTFQGKFASYDLVVRKSRELARMGRAGIKMPDGERFTVIYKGITPNKGLLRIALEYGDFRTKVRIHDGGMFFQAGKKYRGGVLVVAVKAKLIED